MARKFLAADLLCGAGGSSAGLARALRDLNITNWELVCVNHWPTAIETHKANHPHARHYCQDIATVRPHIVVPEGYLDLLMASPTCTHHSVARGGKPTSDQQRSDPWHIVTWLTELRVKRIIIENVWEFCGWGPVDPRTAKPIKSRKGEYFRAWIETIRRLGFEPEWHKLNAADFGDATTRQRFILMARNDARPVSWPMPTHARQSGGELILFPGVKPWRPAREIIDWKIKGRSIFNRKKPLAPKTLARIYAGAVKFRWPEPFLVILRNHMAGQSVDGPLPTIAAGGTHIGLAQPIVLANRTNNAAKGVDGSPVPCLTTAHGGGIALAQPFIVSAAHGIDADDSNPHDRRVKSADEPLGTIHAGGGNFAVAEPVFINGRRNNRAKAVSTDPIPTLDSKGGVWLAEPFVLATGSTGVPRSTDEPIPTVTTGGAGSHDPGCARPMLVEPFILSRHAGGAPRSIDNPTPTQCAKHSPVLISPYYSNGGERLEMPLSAETDPLPTITSKARFGMVVPITHSDSSNRVRDVDAEPLATITTAHRGELAFVTAQHGERPGQAPRVHDIAGPTPTIAASGHIDLVEPTAEYDILFRMLEPHELAAAMGFNSEERAYEFAGTKTEQIKQIGNAVSVAKMRACVAALCADAAREPKAMPAVKIAAAE
jgi:DNA (cytosine-5)-methyltransferase 1